MLERKIGENESKICLSLTRKWQTRECRLSTWSVMKSKGNQLLNQVNSYMVSKNYSDKANECKKGVISLTSNSDEVTDNSFWNPYIVNGYVLYTNVCFHYEILFLMQ